MSSSLCPQPTAHDRDDRDDQGDDVGGSTVTCSRRGYLQRVGTTAAAAGVIGAGGSKVAPQYAPVGRARGAPVPLLPLGAIGATIAADILLGNDTDERGSDEYETLERLAIWAEAYSNAADRQATWRSMLSFVQDFSEFANGNLYAESSLAALQAADDGDSEEDSIQYGVDQSLDELAKSQEKVINEAHLHFNNFGRLLSDIEVVSDLSWDDILDHRGESEHSEGQEVDSLELVDSSVTLEYELVNGDTLQTETIQLEMDGRNVSSAILHLEPATGEPDVVGDSGVLGDLDDWFDDADTETPSAFFVDGFPEDEYDELDDDDQEAIEPPTALDDHPSVFEPGPFQLALEAIDDLASDIEDEVESYLTNIYDDLVDGDLTVDEAITPSMLAEISADEQTFPYAGASLAGLGLPMSEETVTLRFPESENEDGYPPESTGNLFAYPMPASGFNVGSEYDPESLDTTIYYAFHTVDEETGEQSSEVVELMEPFEVLSAQRTERDEETGEWVIDDEVDEITYSDNEVTEAPTDYEELEDVLNTVNELEEKLATQQQEIVVDLEGNTGGGGGSFLPDFDGSASDVASAIAGALVVLAGIFGIGYLAGN